MNRSTIAADYERQLFRHLQDDLNRRLRQVDGIITRTEMAMMLVNIGTSMLLGAQVFAATNSRPDTNVPAMLDDMTVTVATNITRNRERVLRAAAAIQRGERPDEWAL